MANPEAEQFLTEGQRLLDAGDKINAHAQFIKASEADPDNEKAWLGRARSTSNVDEALSAFDRALTLNPNNNEAREEMTYLQVRRWRDVTANETDHNEKPRRSRARVLARMALVVLVILAVLAGGSYLLLSYFSLPVLFASDAPTPAPTLSALQLPPTWTPTLTPSPTPTVLTSTPTATATPVGVTGTLKDTANIRAGPATYYAIVGGLTKDDTITIVARSNDGRWYQFQNPDKNSLAWVFADLVQVTNGDAKSLAVATAPPYTPIPTRVAIATATPPSTAPPDHSSDFVGHISLRAPNCGTWYISGTVTDRYGIPLRGIQVRIMDESGQMIAGARTGDPDIYRPGYWQWVFPQRQDVQGKVAIVDAAGNLRSQPIDFALDASCKSDNDVNQIVIDFQSVQF